MKKNSISIITMALVAGCFVFSCSKETGNEEQPIKGSKIVIPAEIVGTKAVDTDGKATFTTSEKVYIAKAGAIDANALNPSAAGASTTFTGTLAGEYSVGNHITVLYNTNASGVVDYSGQDGAIESVKDAGRAADVEIVSLDAGVLTTEPVKLENLQSIFKFTFINSSTSAAISGIRFVRIYSNSNKLVVAYDVLTPANSTYGQVVVSRNTDLADNYIYVALRFDKNPSDEIHFEVIDNTGAIYKGSKTAPTEEGFANGKFYTSTVTVTPVAPGVPYSNIATLKYAINTVGDISSLSGYIGKYLDRNGNIHDSKESGDVGIIAYLSKSDIPWHPQGVSTYGNALSSQSDISFSGKRMLVLALTDFTSKWDTLKESGFTYDVQKPTGSTKWFVPSRHQMRELMGITSPRAGAATKISFATGTYYWSCSKDSNTKAYCFNTSTNGWTYKDMTTTYYVLPCFAF